MYKLCVSRRPFGRSFRRRIPWQTERHLPTLLALAIVVLSVVSIGQPAFSQDYVPTISHRLVGHQTCVFRLAISPDGETLASGDASGTLILWDLTSSEAIAKITASSSAIRSLVFSVDGRTLALAGSATQWKLYFLNTNKLLRNYSSHKLLRTFDTGNSVRNLHYRDMSLPAFTQSSSGEIQQWNPKTGSSQKIHQRFNTHSEFSTDARLIVEENQHRPGYSTLAVKSVLKSDLVSEFKRLQFRAPISQFSYDGSRVATASFARVDSRDPRIRVWNSQSGLLTADLTHRMQAVNQVAFDRTGSFLCAVGSAIDQSKRMHPSPNDSKHRERISVEIWNLGSMKRYPTVFCEGKGPFFPHRSGHTYCCEFSSDSRLLATSGGGADVVLWQMKKE